MARACCESDGFWPRRMIDGVDHTDALVVALAGRSRANIGEDHAVVDLICDSGHLADGCAFSPITAAPIGAARPQAGALLTSHIAPGRRTLAPSRCAASASRTDAMAAETTSAGWPRSQLLTAPIWVD